VIRSANKDISYQKYKGEIYMKSQKVKKMQGKIEQIEDNKKYARVKIDDEWYSAWDDVKEEIKDLGVGSIIDFRFTEKGKYKNIKNINKKSQNLSVKELSIESYTKGYNDALNDIKKKLDKMFK